MNNIMRAKENLIKQFKKVRVNAVHLPHGNSNSNHCRNPYLYPNPNPNPTLSPNPALNPNRNPYAGGVVSPTLGTSSRLQLKRCYRTRTRTHTLLGLG